MIKGCLLDLDGVVVDTAKYHFQAWKKLANHLGFDFTETQNEALKGVSRMDSLKRILEWGNLKKTEAEMLDLAALKNKWYVGLISEMKPGEELPGARDFLVRVRKAGLKTALGSASKNAQLILDNLELTPLFDAIVDGNHVTHSKPDPEVFLKGAVALQLEPVECVVFEDAIAGIDAAKAAGMHSIGIGEKTVLQSADKVFAGLKGIAVMDIL